MPPRSPRDSTPKGAGMRLTRSIKKTASRRKIQKSRVSCKTVSQITSAISSLTTKGLDVLTGKSKNSWKVIPPPLTPPSETNPLLVRVSDTTQNAAGYFCEVCREDRRRHLIKLRQISKGTRLNDEFAKEEASACFAPLQLVRDKLATAHDLAKKAIWEFTRDYFPRLQMHEWPESHLEIKLETPRERLVLRKALQSWDLCHYVVAGNTYTRNRDVDRDLDSMYGAASIFGRLCSLRNAVAHFGDTADRDTVLALGHLRSAQEIAVFYYNRPIAAKIRKLRDEVLESARESYREFQRLAAILRQGHRRRATDDTILANLPEEFIDYEWALHDQRTMVMFYSLAVESRQPITHPDITLCAKALRNHRGFNGILDAGFSARWALEQSRIKTGPPSPMAVTTPVTLGMNFEPTNDEEEESEGK